MGAVIMPIHVNAPTPMSLRSRRAHVRLATLAMVVVGISLLALTTAVDHRVFAGGTVTCNLANSSGHSSIRFDSTVGVPGSNAYGDVILPAGTIGLTYSINSGSGTHPLPTKTSANRSSNGLTWYMRVYNPSATNQSWTYRVGFCYA